MIWPYRPEVFGRETRYRPLMPVRLHANDRHVGVLALLDSGSDQTLFGLTIAQRLALPYRDSEQLQFTGVGGDSYTGYRVPVELMLGTYRWQTDVVFTEALTGMGLLGQVGFFDSFTVTFRYKRREIDVRRSRG